MYAHDINLIFHPVCPTYVLLHVEHLQNFLSLC